MCEHSPWPRDPEPATDEKTLKGIQHGFKSFLRGTEPRGRPCLEIKPPNMINSFSSYDPDIAKKSLKNTEG